MRASPVVTGAVVVGAVVGLTAQCTAATVAAALVFGGPGDGAAAPAGAPARATQGAPSTPTSRATPTTTPTAVPRPTPSPATTRTASTQKPAAAAVALWTVTYVVDGDTLDVGRGGRTERVRIAGIDTPELGQCGYEAAASRMRTLTLGKKVELVETGKQDNRDRYGRLIRYVDVGGETDAGYRLISTGYAIARYDSRDGYGWHVRQASYVTADAATPRAYSCPTPTPATKPPATAAPTTCVIKGNIASDGERIYHVPGQQYYDVTVITLSKGERWFCSEAEAVAAGWRRSKV